MSSSDTDKETVSAGAKAPQAVPTSGDATLEASVWKDQLEQILSESVDSAQHRAQSAFIRHEGANLEKLVLFGAGSLGRRTLASLRAHGTEPLCFADSNPARWGEQITGVPIVGPEEALARFGADATFLITVWSGTGKDRMQDRVRQLQRIGCRCVVPFLALYWQYPDIFLPHYSVDLPAKILGHADRIRAGFCLLSDEASQREFVAQLRFRLLGDFDGLPGPVDGGFYFRDDIFHLGPEESLVDCGAYDGDTIRGFLRAVNQTFRSIVAFEPDPGNFELLGRQVAELPEGIRERIRLVQAATGADAGMVRMEIGNGQTSTVGMGDFEVQCLTLDQVLDGQPLTFLKMDIEGSEGVTLAGGQECIVRNQPILAISAYHKQSDLWEIPLQIAAMKPEHAFYLKPHLLEGWDLVCYAVPPHRRV